MLYAIVFVCGAALMGLELVAARVLAPAMGNSIFVWGAVISVVMVALSLGYWLGGRLADRFGASRILAPVIAAAGVTTVIAPSIASWVLPPTAGLGPRLGSLAATMLIFFVPALLLAMVSPMGVRLAATKGLAHIGASSGALYAISTGGSIVGTLATSFWLIPALDLEPLIVGIGATLLTVAFAALSLPVLTREPETTGSRSVGPVAARTTVALLLLGAILGALVWSAEAEPPRVNAQGETILFRKDTQYHRITVTEDKSARHLRFDRSHQSAISTSDWVTSEIRYPDYFHLAMALKPDAKRVLVLGLGGGAATKRFWNDYPGISIDSVEIDAVVVDVAKRYFYLPEDERIDVHVADARRYVQTTNETYDIVIVDAYYADSLPFHLTTDEFFREVKGHLSPDGVVAYNVISSMEGPDSKLFRGMYRTAEGVWDGLWVFGVDVGQGGDPSLRQNIMVLATDSTVSEAELLARIRSRVGGSVKVPGFERFAGDIYRGHVKMSDVPKLTDSHAPTDSLIKVQ